MGVADSPTDSRRASRMPTCTEQVPRIFIPSPERSVIVPFSVKFGPRYSTTHGLARRLLGFEVLRFDTVAPFSRWSACSE